MDIHFCDLCGARVTDVDLRGGHGIRKDYDVICATCVELGHSKEWLASHQRGKAAINASQPAVAALAATKSNQQSPVITIARDRVQTLEEGDDSPTVTPQVLPADEPANEPADEPDNHVDDELVNREKSDDTDRQQANNQFAAAASSFSALAATNHKVDAAADVEEYSEQGEGLSDESTAAPILADPESAQEAPKATTDTEGDSPFDFNEDKKSGSFQKDETLPGHREPLVTNKPAGDSQKKSTPSSGATRKSGTNNKSHSANGKASSKASRSGKGPSRQVNKNKNILMMTGLSIGILTMILLITIQSTKKPRKEQERIEVDISDEVKRAIKDAKFNVTKALNSGGLKECEAARAQVWAVMPEISKFEKVATSQNPPWTQEDMGQYLQNIGWNDLNSLLITLNQKIAKLKISGGN